MPILNKNIQIISSNNSSRILQQVSKRILELFSIKGNHIIVVSSEERLRSVKSVVGLSTNVTVIKDTQLTTKHLTFNSITAIEVESFTVSAKQLLEASCSNGSKNIFITGKSCYFIDRLIDKSKTLNWSFEKW